MSAKSFEHCIDQVVRFHFPYTRNLQYAHWNAHESTPGPFVGSGPSALSFVESVDRLIHAGIALGSPDFVNLWRRGKKRWTHKVRAGVLLETRELYREPDPKELTEGTGPFGPIFLGKKFGRNQHSKLSDLDPRGNSRDFGDEET